MASTFSLTSRSPAPVPDLALSTSLDIRLPARPSHNSRCLPVFRTSSDFGTIYPKRTLQVSKERRPGRRDARRALASHYALSHATNAIILASPTLTPAASTTQMVRANKAIKLPVVLTDTLPAAARSDVHCTAAAPVDPTVYSPRLGVLKAGGTKGLASPIYIATTNNENLKKARRAKASANITGSAPPRPSARGTCAPTRSLVNTSTSAFEAGTMNKLLGLRMGAARDGRIAADLNERGLTEAKLLRCPESRVSKCKAIAWAVEKAIMPPGEI
ncbi:hypothetical protein B0H13DRAFT_1850143 [Mycena leptocephala]|nr:hypothetical protein B0H13DRAFT_1850143 [Mycena leptocephala]